MIPTAHIQAFYQQILDTEQAYSRQVSQEQFCMFCGRQSICVAEQALNKHINIRTNICIKYMEQNYLRSSKHSCVETSEIKREFRIESIAKEICSVNTAQRMQGHLFEQQKPGDSSCFQLYIFFCL